MRTGSKIGQQGVQRRPTINDIARLARVAKGTASYALNGRPGVAQDTRARVLAAAAELGWEPSSAARALSGARSEAVGLILARSPEVLAFEPYFMTLVSGIEAELSAHGYSLMLRMVGSHEEEVAGYRRWAGRRSVDGVLVQDLRTEDQRIPVLKELGLPAVLMGISEGEELPALHSDEAGAATEVVRYLAALGHRRLAHVSGPAIYRHTQTRVAAFRNACAEAGIEVTSLESDYTGGQGAQLTRQLLITQHPPTAVMYDNDVMAVAALGVARELGRDIPRDLSVIAWDDSPLCRLTHPAVTALSHDTPGYGARAVSLLVQAISGERDTSVHIYEVPRLLPRGTTAPLSEGGKREDEG